MSLPLRSPFEEIQSVDRALEDLLVRFVINCPDEDLSSEERVMFQIEEASWFYLDYVRMANVKTIDNLPKLKIKKFATKMIELCPIIWKWDNETIEQALQKFSLYKKTIPVRGAAIFNEKLNQILLVQGTESKSWSFPRGKISKDESDVDCCIRECIEEIGFDLSDYIDENEYLERNISGKNYKIYLIKNVPKDTVFEPKAKFEIENIKWIDFRRIGSYIFNHDNDSKKNQKYYLVNSMWRALDVWVKKEKQLLKYDNDLQLMQRAERELKVILGLVKEGELEDKDNITTVADGATENQKSNNVDPGRDLLNMLHSAVQKNGTRNVDESGKRSQTILQGMPPHLLPTTNAENGPAGQFPNNGQFPINMNENGVNGIAHGTQLPPMMNPLNFNFPFNTINPVLPEQLQKQLFHNLSNAHAPMHSAAPPHPMGLVPPPGPDMMYPQMNTPIIKPSFLNSLDNEQPNQGAKQLLSILKHAQPPVSHDKAETQEDSQKLLNILQKPTQAPERAAGFHPDNSTNVNKPMSDEEFYEKYHKKPDIKDNDEFFKLLNRHNTPEPVTVPTKAQPTQDNDSFDEFESSDEEVETFENDKKDSDLDNEEEFFDAESSGMSSSGPVHTDLNGNSDTGHHDYSEDDLNSLVDESEFNSQQHQIIMPAEKITKMVIRHKQESTGEDQQPSVVAHVNDGKMKFKILRRGEKFPEVYATSSLPLDDNLKETHESRPSSVIHKSNEEFLAEQSRRVGQEERVVESQENIAPQQIDQKIEEHTLVQSDNKNFVEAHEISSKQQQPTSGQNVQEMSGKNELLNLLHGNTQPPFQQHQPDNGVTQNSPFPHENGFHHGMPHQGMPHQGMTQQILSPMSPHAQPAQASSQGVSLLDMLKRDNSGIPNMGEPQQQQHQYQNQQLQQPYQLPQSPMNYPMNIGAQYGFNNFPNGPMTSMNDGFQHQHPQDMGIYGMGNTNQVPPPPPQMMNPMASQFFPQQQQQNHFEHPLNAAPGGQMNGGKNMADSNILLNMLHNPNNRPF